MSTQPKEFEVMQPEDVMRPEKANGQELVARNPMDLMQIALSHQAGIEVIERLAALQEKAMARDAEMQFNDAMNCAQKEIGRIAPDSHNNQTNSDWASYAAMDRVLRPVYVRHGFSLSFTAGDSPAETVKAICFVSHRAGHTRTYASPPMPADGKGAKGGDVMTKTHATGAAMSYAMRYLLKYIFNVAIGAQDNDGNGQAAATTNRLPDERYLQLRDGIEGAGNLAELDRLYKAALTEAGDDAESKSDFSKAKNKRYRELHNVGR